MLNKKGMSLIELMVCVAIIGILAPIMSKFFITMTKTIVKAQRTEASLTTAINNCGPKMHLTPLTTQCKALDGRYYGKSPDGDTLHIYTDASCNNFYGSLGRLANESWFNKSTNSFWQVFNDSGFTLLIVKY
jgi:prepilin-type N-terminal cleavage/methylation domain-containing protein